MERKRNMLGALALLGVIGTTACGGLLEPDEQYCDICDLRVYVVAEVRGADGEAVPGAAVSLRPVYGSTLFDHPTVTHVETDARGRFEATVTGLSIFGPDAVEIQVSPASGSALSPLLDTIPAEFALPRKRPNAIRPILQLTTIATK